MGSKQSRSRHRSEVISFLRRHVRDQDWVISHPPYGTGNETYYAESSEQAYFVKLGAETDRYWVMAELGLSPQVITTGQLEDGTSILVQQRVDGKHPSRKDFQRHLRKFAESIQKTHQSAILKQILPARSSTLYKDVGLEILEEVEQRWKKVEAEVPAFAQYINEKIRSLKEKVGLFPGGGLVASHGDICNGNWLVSPGDERYLLDYESMSLDDPALDVGAILWWYYPPEMRAEFLEIAGYANDEGFQNRMKIRMAIHNLNIIIPREKSFDRFTAESFDEALVDFRAVVDGRENPQGYAD